MNREFYQEIKNILESARNKVYQTANFAMVEAYWQIGKSSFGFTEQDVKELLSYYEMKAALETVREWYDGYLFGGTSVYCPWDVIKYVQALQKDRNAGPKNY